MFCQALPPSPLLDRLGVSPFSP